MTNDGVHLKHSINMLNASSLYKPDFWSDPVDVHKLFSEMRHKAPILHCRSDNYPDLWHITRHADILAIENAANIFENAPRMTIKTLQLEEAVREITGGRPYMVKGLTAMDAPAHQPMRSVVQKYFTPKKINQLKANIVLEAANAIANTKETDGCFDFATQIAFQYPLRVIMPILGVPEEDYQLIFKLTKQLFGPADPDNKRTEVNSHKDPFKAVKDVYKDFYEYFSNMLDQKRKRSSSDLISQIASAISTVTCMDKSSAIHYCILLATAGHDTTSYSLSEAVYQIALDPALLTSIARDPERISQKVSEEAFRLAAPTRHFIRTANQDVTISGSTFHSGDSVILWYPSACRDELIYPDPDNLKLDRLYKVPQPAFGSGPHICLGMHLARLELICFLQEFGRQIGSIELVNPPIYTESNFVGGIKRLPLRLAWRQASDNHKVQI